MPWTLARSAHPSHPLGCNVTRFSPNSRLPVLSILRTVASTLIPRRSYTPPPPSVLTPPHNPPKPLEAPSPCPTANTSHHPSMLCLRSLIEVHLHLHAPPCFSEPAHHAGKVTVTVTYPDVVWPWVSWLAIAFVATDPLFDGNVRGTISVTVFTCVCQGCGFLPMTPLLLDSP